MACNDKNPLTREGSSKMNRVLAALSTSYAKVDERDQADILLFARRYAGYLNYFSSAGSLDGTWEDLMKMDVSVVLATLARIRIRDISDYKRQLYKKIKLAPADTDAKKQFRFLFDALFSLCSSIDEQFRLLPSELDYKNRVAGIIGSRLQLPLANIEKCFNDFKTISLLDYSTTELDGSAPLHVTSDPNFHRSALSSEWNSATPDLDITIPPGLPDAKSAIVYVINHNLFNAQLEQLINGTATLIDQAWELFNRTLDNFPKHSPHYALFLAFVRLFRYLQDDLNTYTKRHLDFYFKDVLQLGNKAAEPDSVHLTFELQKPVQQLLLKKGRLFKGGKDSTGKEISYSLSDDLVISKASVSQLQSWQKTTRSGRQVLIASPVAASEDGQGGKLTSADKSWFTFGDVKKALPASTGFIIASNLLYLKEGKRKIIVTVNFAGSSDISGFADKYDLNCFRAELTGKKGWTGSGSLSVSAGEGNNLVFTINLTPKDPSIIPYSGTIHKENLEIDLPILRIYYEQEKPNGIPYPELAGQSISSVHLTVSADDVRDLSLNNGQGKIDASKPFKPFGDFPASGSEFFVGSKEVFQKPLTKVQFITDLADFQNVVKNELGVLSISQADVKYAIAPVGTPCAEDGGSQQSLTQAGLGLRTCAITNFPVTGVDFGPNEPITALTREGFFRFTLQSSDYSMDAHLGRVTSVMNQTTLTETSEGSATYKLTMATPPSPKEIVMNTFSVDYTAEETIQFTAADAGKNSHFYHFTPFGYAEVHPLLFEEGITSAEKALRMTLIPNLAEAGELFIGIENAAPDTVVTILFQLADGSSNPLQDMETLNWWYLTKNNIWKSYGDHQVIDNTKNFTQSGIITFTLPPDIFDRVTAHKSGLLWLKGSAGLHTDAVCKIILVQAQAGKAALVQDEENGIEFRQVLPAGTITKLVESESGIKLVSQPADSFEGKTRETDDHFYLRVSERLRHKQRAVSIWDYEHIVLEKFPEVYKVRCLNHTGFYRKKAEDEEIFCENFPGHVTIVPVPDLRNKTLINPIKPYTPVRLLTNIGDHLSKRISPFVRLHVKNPRFEEIRLSFKVKFYDNLDVSFYRQLLDTEIERFLCPWAWDSNTEIAFGGKVVKSVLLNFVEERPYVDYVTFFRMDHILERQGSLIKKANLDIEEAIASTSLSILVSYYDPDETDDTRRRHLIDTQISC